MTVILFIQARMSSQRYPGKVLAPLNGSPIIKLLIDQAQKVTLASKIVILTSADSSDDPLVAYLEKLGVEYFRGNLNNVFLRFKQALEIFPCEFFGRICADSPFISADLIDAALKYINPSIDIVSNVFKRTFPKGQSIEIIRTEAFCNISIDNLALEDMEHVTSHFYRHPQKYQILSLLQNKDESGLNMCVDTLEDLKSFITLPPSYIFQANTLCPTIV